MMEKHTILEKNSLLMTICILVVVSIGGIVEMVPLFYLESTIEKVKGMRPYTPLEFAGRQIYIREGCYNCHSQMIRPLRDEVERYGHYSLAAESMYDHPFQWGSKRTGPDLARVGGKYSDDWHIDHFQAPRSVVPESIMPGYPFLATTELDFEYIYQDLMANRMVGVPYSEDMIEAAVSDVTTQLDEFADDYDGFQERYPGAIMRDFDGNPDIVSELDAMIAYMQMLGTLVDFDAFEASDAPR